MTAVSFPAALPELLVLWVLLAAATAALQGSAPTPPDPSAAAAACDALVAGSSANAPPLVLPFSQLSGDQGTSGPVAPLLAGAAPVGNDVLRAEGFHPLLRMCLLPSCLGTKTVDIAAIAVAWL